VWGRRTFPDPHTGNGSKDLYSYSHMFEVSHDMNSPANSSVTTVFSCVGYFEHSPQLNLLKCQ
jgi:hypothetical protein